MKENLPIVLTELRDENAIQLNCSELLKQCQNTEISVTAEQANAVENATREQSNSKLWYRFRAGRITTSKMKTVCCTDPTLPAQSLSKVFVIQKVINFLLELLDGVVNTRSLQEIYC